MASTTPSLTQRRVIEYLRERIPNLEWLGVDTFQKLKTLLEEKEDREIPTVHPVPPPPLPVRVIHDRHTVKVPRPTVVVDTRERDGFAYTFERFPKWFAGVERRKLNVGDYTIKGLERRLAVERKSLTDLVTSAMVDRQRFLEQCRCLGALERKLLVVEAGLAETKSCYRESQAHPNAVVSTLIALQERWGIQVLWCDNATLAEEAVAHVLSKYYTLHWLEANRLPRHFVDGDI